MEAIYNFKSIKAIATGLKDYESEVEQVKPVTPEPAEGWHVYWQNGLYGTNVDASIKQPLIGETDDFEIYAVR